MENIVCEEHQVAGDQLGHMVGEGYVIHEQTATVLDNINKRLNEEEKGVRTYRRALAFSKVILRTRVTANTLQR